MSLRVAFRCDVSIAIGTGHVARCMSLAAAVRNAEGHAVFVMRDLPGNMLARVADLGFEVRTLPAPAANFVPTAKLAHAAWAGVSGAQLRPRRSWRAQPGTGWSLITMRLILNGKPRLALTPRV